MKKRAPPDTLILFLLTLSPFMVNFFSWLNRGDLNFLNKRPLPLVMLDVLFALPWLFMLFLLVYALRIVVARFESYQKWLSWLFAFTLALPITVENTHRYYLSRPINPQFWSLLFETTANEKLGYLSAQLLNIFILFLIVFVPLALFFNKLKTVSIRLHQLRYLAYGLTVSLALIFNLSFFRDKQVSHQAELMDEATNGPTEALSYIFPFNWFYSYHTYANEKVMIGTMSKLRHQKIVQYTSANHNPDLVFLIIGESSTSSHWSLNDHHNKTNPLLEKRNDIFFFKQIYSLGQVTRTAVPLLLRLFTKADAKYIYDDPSIVQAYKSAGYTTHWLSMQARSGQFDDTIRSISADSDDERFINPLSFEASGFFDQLVVDQLPDLQSLQGKHLFVLHTLGSHIPYQNRYPSNFDLFTPSLEHNEGIDIFSHDKNHLQKILNSYDNSILYTDFIINQVIEKLAASNKTAVLGYISDHGQALTGEKCRFIGHDDSCLSSVHVPMLFWSSTNQSMFIKNELAALRLQQDKKHDSSSFAMTLLSLSGINYEHRLDSSLLTNQ